MINAFAIVIYIWIYPYQNIFIEKKTTISIQKLFFFYNFKHVQKFSHITNSANKTIYSKQSRHNLYTKRIKNTPWYIIIYPHIHKLTYSPEKKAINTTKRKWWANDRENVPVNNRIGYTSPSWLCSDISTVINRVGSQSNQKVISVFRLLSRVMAQLIASRWKIRLLNIICSGVLSYFERGSCCFRVWF